MTRQASEGNDQKTRWHLVFSGKVQHVGFRYTAYYLAKEMYLTGWVDNLPSGQAEMEVQGPVSQLRKYLIRLKSQPHIHIEKAEIKEIEPVRFERKFAVRGY